MSVGACGTVGHATWRGAPAGSRSRRRIAPGLIAGALAGVATVMALTACRAQAQPDVERVRGLVLGVTARSIAQADSVTLRADDGRELVFLVDPAVDVTPGHLREHMTLAEPVIVHYRTTGEGLLAIRIDDG